MKPANSILSEYGTTVFTVMSALAVEHGSINLGQGFPDTEGPEDIRRVAADTVMKGPNQYPPMLGIPALRQAVAEANKRFYDLDVNWQTEVMVTSGATEALADCFLGLIEPGEEVVLIEPLYDSYLPMVRRAGGVPKLVRMAPPEWQMPRADLEAAFSDRTKLLVLNSPHNPSGKVFDEDDLRFLARLVIEHDAYAVCDEVYEHLVFDGHKHRPLMTMPGMRERAIRIGSAGKTFSATGWKVGSVTAAAPLLTAVAKAHQFVTFTTPPNLQMAAAYGLRQGEEYFDTLAADMQAKRDRLGAGLAVAGFHVLPSSGTYFLTVDIRSVGFNGSDEDFCRHITTEAGVTAVPMSAFYQCADITRFARFCFCKRDQLLDEACARLQRHFTSHVTSA
ncbi:MAG: aminotransferase [Rhodospirillales bacterium]|nr:aminotransferase [Rhodospirillales bacterium]